jgi:hypothetical protein
MRSRTSRNFIAPGGAHVERNHHPGYPERVVAFNTAEGWSRHVSEDIAGEVLDRAFDADDTARTPSDSSTGM